MGSAMNMNYNIQGVSYNNAQQSGTLHIDASQIENFVRHPTMNLTSQNHLHPAKNYRD